MQTTFIYTLSCPITGQIRYVGKSNNIKKRINQHIYRIKKTNNLLEKDIWINDLTSKKLKPIIEILDEVALSEWDYWERFWISTIISWGFNLTNIRKGGNGYGFHSVETIERIRKSQSGRKNSMYGKSSCGFLNKTHNNETKNKISEKNSGKATWLGKKHSDETKLKMSKNRKGKPKSIGRILSEETKRKISESLKNRNKSIDNNN